MFPPEIDVGLGGTTLPPSGPVTGGAVRTKDPASVVALGGSHSLALTLSGKVFGFGRLEDNRLGVELDPVRGFGDRFPCNVFRWMFSEEQVFRTGRPVRGGGGDSVGCIRRGRFYGGNAGG